MKSTLGRAFVVLALSGACARTAHADESSAAAAQTLFKEGRALLQQGKFADACDRLGRSDRLDPAVGTRLSLGECHEGLGRTASAWAAYNQASALAMQRGDPRSDVAKKRAAALEPKLAKVTIRVTTKVPDLVVRRNGTEIDPAALETTIPVDAGPQSIDAGAPSYQRWSTRIEIKDGESKEVVIPTLDPEPANADPRIEPPPSETRGTVALGLEIGGGVAIVTGLVIGGLALSKWSSIEDTCPGGRCRTDADRDRLAPEQSTASTMATASTVVTGLGIVALAVGIVLHVTAPSRLAIAPLVGPKSAGVGGAFRF